MYRFDTHSAKVRSSQSADLGAFCIAKTFASLLLASVFFLISSTQAEQAPTISAHRKSSQTVTVVLNFTAKKQVRSSYLVLARAIGNSKKFRTVSKVKAKRSLAVFVTDSINTDKTIYYKTRLAGKKRSRWSKSVAISPLPPTVLPSPSVPSEDSDQEDSTEPTDTPDSVDDGNLIATPVPTAAPVIPGAPTAPAGISACNTSAIDEVFALVNSARSQNKLPALERPSTLANSALNFSYHLAQTSVLSHTGWFENLQSFGFQGSAMGQNIGYMSGLSASGMMTGWMGSPGHRSNILSGSFRFIGIGCAVDARGMYWWTQDFGG